MENLCKRVDVRLATKLLKLASKLASKPTYVSSKFFNENVVAVHKIKEAITLNSPAYAGMCILDLSTISIITTLKRSMVIELRYYSLTRTA